MGILGQLKKWMSKPQEEARADVPPAPSGQAVGSRGWSAAEPLAVVVPEVSPTELYVRMQEGEDLTLLDVRQPWDHAAQRPAGSVSLPLTELPYRLGELDPNKHYVLSCYHGYTSQDGAAYLIEQGFTNVESLQGGFSGWAAAGLPIER
ncbi:MAG: rhodanese-like domain-containing protein [Ardenticatenaceae bacterium]